MNYFHVVKFPNLWSLNEHGLSQLELYCNLIGFAHEDYFALGIMPGTPVGDYELVPIHSHRAGSMNHPVSELREN